MEGLDLWMRSDINSGVGNWKSADSAVGVQMRGEGVNLSVSVGGCWKFYH